MSALPSLAPGFVLMQSNDLDALRSVLVDWLARVPLPALTDETVIIQSNGMSQWLRLGLCQPRSAGGLGVGLGVSFEFPARVQWQCYRSVLGADRVPKHSPLDKAPLVWRLMRVLPPLLDDPRFAVFHAQLWVNGQRDSSRLYDLCLRLADQWDEYQVYRADWLAHWASGRADLPAGERPLPPEAAWQPVLWRAVLADSADGEQPAQAGRAGLHQAFLEQIAQGDRPADFPPRLIVFGVSSLAPQIFDLLLAAARWSQVIVCIQNPCQVYWADMLPTVPGTVGNRSRQQSHPLLAAWGRQGRDLLRLLMDFEEQASARASAHTSIPLFIDLPEPQGILQHIQQDILHGTAAEELRAQARTAALPDGSLAFHSVHSPLRAVEVLHDQLLAAFAADASLKPEQILVMMPDMAPYAPAVQAIFGRFKRDSPRHIPFALADQPDPAEQARLSVLAQWFDLPNSRFERGELLDWLALPAVQTAQGLTASDVELLHDWLDQAEVFWGLNAEQRTAFGAPPEYTQHSWQFGLDRLFAGYVLGATDGVWQDIAPLGAIEISQSAVIGRLNQFLANLAAAHQFFSEERTPQAWQEGLREHLPRLFQASPDDAATALWLTRVDGAIREWCDDCARANWQDALPATVVQAAVFERLSRHRLTQKFLVSGVNFATLMPMRAIPYRQVYLLGMDERDYPRRQPRHDFDLLADRYRPGDRARQEDDRYLFLEAMLAAQERLVISWVGRAVEDNSPRSPSIVVQQLRDYLDTAWLPLDGAALSQKLTVEHPLQPFSPLYFGAPDAPWFTFDSDWRRVHDFALTETPLAEWTPTEPCTLDDLSKFLKNPLDPLMRIRFGISAPRKPEDSPDHEPFDINGLSDWNIRHELAHSLRIEAPADADLDAWFVRARQRVTASGRMPWRSGQWQEGIEQPLRAQWQRWQAVQQGLSEPSVLPATILPLPAHGVALACPDQSVQVHADGQRLVCAWSDSKLVDDKKIRHEKCFEFWPQHLAAQLSGVPVETRVFGKDCTLAFPSMASDEAERQLTVLLSAWFEALQTPLPVAPNLALAQCTARSDESVDQREKLEKAFMGDERNTKSDHDTVSWMARFWPDLDTLLAAQTERAMHHQPDLADQIYAPLMQGVALAKA